MNESKIRTLKSYQDFWRFDSSSAYQWSDREEFRSSREADRLLWRHIWLLWGLHTAPIPLPSNWIGPKLPDDGLCETPLTAEYREESVSWMLFPPDQSPMLNDLSWSPTVGLSGIFTRASPGEPTHYRHHFAC